MPHPNVPARLWPLCLLLLALVVGSATAAPAPATATVSGVVSNAATGNLLPGATVRLPALGLTARADDTGRYVLHAVPAGEHELIATYAGLEALATRVSVTPGGAARRDFELTSGVYRLGAFTVSGQREGAAAARPTDRRTSERPLDPEDHGRVQFPLAAGPHVLGRVRRVAPVAHHEAAPIQIVDRYKG